MKNNFLLVLILLSLIAIMIFGCSWCYFLEKNQKLLQEQVTFYQNMNYEKIQEMDKRLRIAEQDILILEEGGYE